MTAIGSLPMNNDNISAIFVVDRISQARLECSDALIKF